jgi:FKBP-type peptidyl-prolyl cis-trans isomerase
MDCKGLRAACAPVGFHKVVVTPGPDTTKKPRRGANITMMYVGRTPDGNVFDRSSEFQCQIGVGKLIRGWDVAVLTMAVGECATLYISPSFGYGAAGCGEQIPPNTPLIFQLQLISIND